jgi:hypothetical protein
MDYRKMIQDINKLVETDFCYDMATKEAFSRKFTQEEAIKMADLLGKVYMISHSEHCKACGRKYLKRRT